MCFTFRIHASLEHWSNLNGCFIWKAEASSGSFPSLTTAPNCQPSNHLCLLTLILILLYAIFTPVATIIFQSSSSLPPPNPLSCIPQYSQSLHRLFPLHHSSAEACVVHGSTAASTAYYTSAVYHGAPWIFSSIALLNANISHFSCSWPLTLLRHPGHLTLTFSQTLSFTSFPSQLRHCYPTLNHSLANTWYNLTSLFSHCTHPLNLLSWKNPVLDFYVGKQKDHSNHRRVLRATRQYFFLLQLALTFCSQNCYTRVYSYILLLVYFSIIFWIYYE